ncbi:hypothetical protein [Virgibacillus sp. JSM 102003]|uniref:hypothetical protein n=1 Tax=Virgibacillus sp. JSM 102003 TaxID=1562108 RepID=UPI0035C22E96
MRKANKIINKDIISLKNKLDEENFSSEYMRQYDNLTKDEAVRFFEKIISYRRSLEEKAKSNILIVTISITVILGMASLLFSIPEKTNTSNLMNIILVVLFLLSLVYMTIGSILSLQTLNAGELKQRYELSPEDLDYLSSIAEEDRNKEFKLILSSYNELNNKINLKLNNFASCTYEHIRNSIITFFLLGMFISTIFLINQFNGDEKENNELINQQQSLEQIHEELDKLNKNIGSHFEFFKNDEVKKQQKEILRKIKSIEKRLTPIENDLKSNQ